MPQRVRDVVTARLERLSARNRDLVAVAAVIGREFDFSLLQHAAGLGDRDAAEGLEELVRCRILHGAGEQFDLTHDWTRQVAYDGLLAPRRLALHAAVGRALEALHSEHLDEASERLAYHYSKTEEAGKAVIYLTRVAEKAAAAYAQAKAVATLQEALLHAERLPVEHQDRRVVDLILRQAFSLSILGRVPEVLERLTEQRERVERLGDPSLAGPYHFRLALTHNYLGNHAQAGENARRALEHATRCGDEAIMGKAHYVLALAGYWSGESLAGVEHDRQAVALLERTAERHSLGLAYWVLGVSHHLLGEFDAALKAENRVDAIGAAIGDPRLQSLAAGAIGWIRGTRGEWDAGIEACQRNLTLAPDPATTAAALGYLGTVYLEQGDTVHAIPLLEESVDLFSRVRLRQLQGRNTALLADAYLLKGDADTARVLAIDGLQITTDVKSLYGVGWSQRALGRIARATGAFAEAEGHLNAALQTFASTDARFEVGRTHLALAELGHARRNATSAATHLEEAHTVFTALQVPRYVKRVEELARVVGERKAD